MGDRSSQGFRPGPSYSAPNGAENRRPREPDLMNELVLQDTSLESRSFLHAGHLLAAESALAIRPSPMSVRRPRVLCVKNQ